MKPWIVLFRAGADDRDDGGVDDDVFLVAYEHHESAMRECKQHLRDIFEGEELSTDEIVWEESDDNSNVGLRKFVGRPKADVEGWFDLLQVEVSKKKR